MPRRTNRKATATKVGTEVRHQYAPQDILTGDVWKVAFTLTDPEIQVTLDRGTFEWLWDFVARKGRQADADNFHYSNLHKSVYQRAANQFAVAAQEAFGDTYLVKVATPKSKGAAKEPAEALTAPAKRRRRRKPTDTAKTFEAATEPSKAPVRRKRRKPRSQP